VGEGTEAQESASNAQSIRLHDLGGNKLLCHQIGAVVSGRFQE
jgi:hypothetical protein